MRFEQLPGLGKTAPLVEEPSVALKAAQGLGVILAQQLGKRRMGAPQLRLRLLAFALVKKAGTVVESAALRLDAFLAVHPFQAAYQEAEFLAGFGVSVAALEYVRQRLAE